MLDRLKEVLARVRGDVDLDTVTEETTLTEDLGLDSLAIMLFAMEIEAAFGFRFTEAVKFVTVGDVCSYLRDKNL